MRRQLVLVFLAVSSLVALAFVVPLGFLIRRTAEDNAIDAARSDAAAVVPVLVADGTTANVTAALGATAAGQERRMSIYLFDGRIVGLDIEPSPRMINALDRGQSSIGQVRGGIEVVAAVASGSESISAVRVFVPEATLRQGQTRAWAALAAVAFALVGISVIVADRLARNIVRPTEQLAEAARLLGAGQLETRVEVDGPQELVDLADAINGLGAQVGSMLHRERELVAELSHRLRTPLTKMRLRVEQVAEADVADELRSDLDDVTGVINELISEARGTVVRTQRSDAGAIVAERAEFWQVLAEDQERAWRFQRGGGRLPVAIPAAELAAAVDILLENVFSHTDDGLPLSIGYGREGDAAKIWVADSGPGIEPLATERGQSGAGSTGLGLDIARRTVEKVGGSLTVATSSLGGAQVELRIPLVEGAG